MSRKNNTSTEAETVSLGGVDAALLDSEPIATVAAAKAASNEDPIVVELCDDDCHEPSTSDPSDPTEEPEEEPAPVIPDVMEILNSNWIKVGRSAIGPGYLHDESNAMTDAELLDMFSVYGVKEDKDRTPNGVEGIVFSARLKDVSMDATHQGAESSKAWVGLGFIPAGKKNYTSVTYGTAYGAEKPEEISTQSTELEENINHAEGDLARSGIAFYFDVNSLKDHLTAGEYLWVSIQWTPEEGEESATLYRVKLDLSVTKNLEELADIEVLRNYVELNSLTAKETVNGMPIPDWALRNKYRIKKILDDRVIIQAGFTYILAVKPEDIRA